LTLNPEPITAKPLNPHTLNYKPYILHLNLQILYPYYRTIIPVPSCVTAPILWGYNLPGCRAQRAGDPGGRRCPRERRCTASAHFGKLFASDGGQRPSNPGVWYGREEGSLRSRQGQNMPPLWLWVY